MSNTTEQPFNRLLAARNAQKPDVIPNPMEISIRVENSAKLHIYNVQKEMKNEIEGEERKDSPDKKNPLHDIPKDRQLSFIVIDDATRFLSGLLPVDEAGNKEWFDSTMYRLRKDTVSIYMRKKIENAGFELTKVETDTVENLKPYGDESEIEADAETQPVKKVYKYDFGKMTSCQYIWAYSPQLDALCRVQLSATGRNAYRRFLKSVKRNELPCFTIVGFEPFFGKDSKTKRQSDAPVFEKYVPSNIETGRAETYLEKTAAYTKMDLSALETPTTEQLKAEFLNTVKTSAGEFPAVDATNTGEIPNLDDLPM